jgi:nucleotide-binding universal stress UspA family protein
MYKKILIALDSTPTDRVIIEHVKQLAKLASSMVVLLHVADGWAARTFGQDAVSPEVEEDTVYLKKIKDEFRLENIQTEAELAYGEPANEIIKYANRESCDLIAMSTHGHRFLSDLLYGTTVPKVRHSTSIPVLLIKAAK